MNIDIWKKESEWETKWWGNCINTFYEEQKQLDYAVRMGLKIFWDNMGPHIDCENKTVLDVGGGPVSLLLKSVNLKSGTVIDPCPYPAWVASRYSTANIRYIKGMGEDLPQFLSLDSFDEIWMYNVLQHVLDPEKIVKNCLYSSKIVRVFDWLEIAGPGHPHLLTEDKMNEWFKGIGKVEVIQGGKCYAGIFKGGHYE